MNPSAKFTVALDLGKYKHVATIFDVAANQPLQTLTVSVDQESFTHFEQILDSYSSQVSDFIIGCEATGHYGETLLRRLQQQGYRIVRFNPAQVTQFRKGLGRRAKTDALDADALARQLAVTNWHVEVEVSPTCRALQRMTRLHADCVEERSRWLNRIRGLLNQLFPELEQLLKDFSTPTARRLLQTYPSPRELAQAPLSELTNLLIKASHGTRREAFALALQQAAQTSVGLDDQGLRLELSFALRQLEALMTMTAELEQEVTRLTQQLLAEYSSALGLERPLTLDSFPCGSVLTIGALLAEVGAIERFQSLKQLVSYFGWCPQTHESGTLSNPHPQLSQRGNRFARRTLWMPLCARMAETTSVSSLV